MLKKVLGKLFKKRDFISRLNTYLVSVSSFREIAREVFEEGVVCVKDSLGEFDVYFDWSRWCFENKDVWPDEYVSPPDLRKFGLGVLRGLASSSPPRSFTEAKEFARQFVARRQ